MKQLILSILLFTVSLLPQSSMGGKSGVRGTGVNLGRAGISVASGGATPIVATGGTITYSGGYTIHTFTSSGTFTVTSGSGYVETLVVAGGGGGGGGNGVVSGGGGGAGGLLYDATYEITTQAYTVTVGNGGAGAVLNTDNGNNGTNSVFDLMTAIGGGGGAGATLLNGNNGGSGGGSVGSGGYNGGTGTSGQGSNGGSNTVDGGAAGGGGAGGVGSNNGGSNGGASGGVGLAYSISGTSVYYAGGGGGGSFDATGGSGGNGGGGAGASGASANAGNGTINTGGGGGGARLGTRGNGGSGIVIIRYLSDPVIDSYTKLLLHMDGTNGSTTFTDEIGKTVTPYGNAQISTAQSKFGGASALFDGTGDYLTTPTTTDFQFGSGAFTVDMQFRMTATANDLILFAVRQDVNNSILFYLKATNLPALLIFEGGVIKGYYYAISSLTNNTWYHLAFVRSGDAIAIYVDGVSIAITTSTALSAGYSIPAYTGTTYVGYDVDNGYYTGYLDELRISKGIARWTSNFTPPPSPYPNGQ